MKEGYYNVLGYYNGSKYIVYVKEGILYLGERDIEDEYYG